MDFDSTLKYVAKNNIPVRVSLQEGHMLDKDEMGADGSKVKARILDDEPWSVSYDMKTGECVLTRGIIRGMATDQFGYLKIDPSYRTLKGQVLNRSKKVREIALLRSKGHCECCGEKGFETEDGRLFLETHHIEPLSEGGDDSSENVIALCANHHRQAHYGKDKGEFRKLLVKALRKKLLLCG
ncbi:MAG: HNH endonuclease [Pseudobacteriovorax sp.]|nr:HNH endonuclease [Pseudobacteriovorax sp.]